MPAGVQISRQSRNRGLAGLTKYVYTVHYDSKELIDHAIRSIDANLFVSELRYVMTVGDQKDVDSFGGEQTTT